jgi:hypothetical protein
MQLDMGSATVSLDPRLHESSAAFLSPGKLSWQAVAAEVQPIKYASNRLWLATSTLPEIIWPGDPTLCQGLTMSIISQFGVTDPSS